MSHSNNRKFKIKVPWHQSGKSPYPMKGLVFSKGRTIRFNPNSGKKRRTDKISSGKSEAKNKTGKMAKTYV